MADRDWQSMNALSAISVTESGILIALSLLQFSKADSPIFVKVDGRDMADRDWQYMKASSAISVTPSGTSNMPSYSSGKRFKIVPS